MPSADPRYKAHRSSSSGCTQKYGVISRASVSLIMCTGGAWRPLRQVRHFSEASSFHSGVSRGRRMSASGRLARELQRLHSPHRTHRQQFIQISLADNVPKMIHDRCQ
jgi:hypothetical protein